MAPSISKGQTIAMAAAPALPPSKTKKISKSKTTNPTTSAFEASSTSATTVRSQSNISRIWNDDDEQKLLESLCQFKEQHNQLPHPDDYASFLSSFPPNHFSFLVTKKHLTNKLKVFREGYNKAKANPSSVKKGHKTFVFKKCCTLFGTDEAGDGAYHYLLDFVEENARKFPRITEVSFDEIVELMGVPMMSSLEKQLQSIKRCSSKLKIRKTKFLAKFMAKIHAKLDKLA